MEIHGYAYAACSVSTRSRFAVGPVDLVASLSTCHLEDEVPPVADVIQALEQGIEVRISAAEWDGPSAQHAVLDVNAANAAAVCSELRSTGRIRETRCCPSRS